MTLSRQEQVFEKRFRQRLVAWSRGNPWPGIVTCAALTWLAATIHTLPVAPFTLPGNQHPVSDVLLALLMGIALRNLAPATRQLKPGIDVVIKRCLPFGIILLGAELDFYDLIRVSLRVLVGAVFIISITVCLARYLARLLGVGEKLGLLIGVGTAICGSSAVVAVAPVVDAAEEDIAFSIAVVNLFGVAAMMAFPVLGALMRLAPDAYGIWCGLSIHATPQVIAAGFAHPGNGPLAGKVATIVKLTRISLLGPVVFVVGARYAYQRRRQEVYVGHAVNYRKLFPTFIVFFLALALLRTLGFFPEITLHLTDRFVLGGGDRTLDLAKTLGWAAKWIITGAMSGVGLTTEFRALKAGGGTRPFVLGLLTSVAIALMGLAQALL